MLAQVISLVGLILVLGSIIQNGFGILKSRAWKLADAPHIYADGMAFKARLPPWATGQLAETRATLLQDGKPIGQVADHTSTVTERGNGWFKITNVNIYFSLPANKDPRPEIARYSLVVPAAVKPAVCIVGVLLLVGGLFLIRANPQATQPWGRIVDYIESFPIPTILVGVFVFSLAVRSWRVAAHPDFSDGCFCVKGVPYSDAFSWDELAANLANGGGFSGGFTEQRPLYPVMLSAIYTIGGHSPAAAAALNIFWGALAGMSVCAIGILGGSRLAGLAAAATLLMSDDYFGSEHLIMTETSGLVFATSSVLLLGLALAKPSWWRIIAAGLMLACGNLASGFGLFAVPAYGLVALITWWRGQGVKKALLQAAVLTAVVILTWLPWLVRQRVVNGIWNLSSSSADLMYAAANPAYGKLNAEVKQEWEKAGVPNEAGARYRFYMRRYAEEVKAHPLAYLEAIGHGTVQFLDFWRFEGGEQTGVVSLALIAAALATFLRRQSWAVLVAGVSVLAGVTWLDGASSIVLWTIATPLALMTCSPRQRPLWALVAVTVPSVAILAGMTGGHLGRRMWTACDWSMLLLIVQGGSGLIRTLAHGLALAASRMGGAQAPLKPERGLSGVILAKSLPKLAFAGTIIGWTLLGHAFIGTSLAVSKYVARGEGAPAIELGGDTRAVTLEQAKRHFDFLKLLKADDPRWWSHVGEIGLFPCVLQPWEDVGHWARRFDVRPYLRTVAYPELLEYGKGAYVACQLRIMAEKLPRDEPVLFFGISNFDANAPLGQDTQEIEVLCYAPLDVSSRPARAQWDKAVWLPASPEAEAISTSLSKN